jgi:FixJ family two-component response regulator
MANKAPCIFVVDDDASVRKALKRLMTSNGLPVETFGSATEFLESHNIYAPGCMILDVRMPGITGLDLQMNLAAKGSNLPIIFITAHDDDTARKQAMDAGARAWLIKPVNEDDLLKAITAAVQQQKGIEPLGFAEFKVSDLSVFFA